MPPRSPVTPHDVVKLIESDTLLLPAIQRVFVWRPRQIQDLFDSMMRDYPIGSLLLWSTRPRENPKLGFHRVTSDGRGRDTPRIDVKPPGDRPVLAVLDGQQRVTALNIGLRGTLAASPTGVVRRLYLDLDEDNPKAGSEDTRYGFRFQTTTEAEGEEAPFLVAHARRLKRDRMSLDSAMNSCGIQPTASRRRVLGRLAEVVNDEKVVRFEIERGDLDRVLNVFARINKGGTQLSYVDLLVGTATSKWPAAGEEFRALRRDMNNAGHEPFDFSIDRIVKTALVLLDVPEPKFHVESILAGQRLVRLRDEWPRLREALILAAKVLGRFGLSAKTLPAQNAMIPVAYYAWHRRLGPTYVTAPSHERDLDRVRAFVARTLLERGYWTGAVDSVLVTSREVIKKHGAKAFPLSELRKALDGKKSIAVDDDFVEELSWLRYQDRRLSILLRLLFPHMLNHLTKETLDKDHIFPTSRFRPGVSRPAGVTAAAWSDACEWADRLPNIQLLGSGDNRADKLAKMPEPWFRALKATTKKRYTAQHVKYLPKTLDGALGFWDRRYEALESDIRRLLLC